MYCCICGIVRCLAPLNGFLHYLVEQYYSLWYRVSRLAILHLGLWPNHETGKLESLATNLQEHFDRFYEDDDSEQERILEFARRLENRQIERETVV